MRVGCPFRIKITGPRQNAPAADSPGSSTDNSVDNNTDISADSSSQVWRITFTNSVHERHNMNPSINQFGNEALRLSPEMLSDVKKYARNGLDIKGARNLLEEDFPSKTFERRKLSNALYKSRKLTKGIITDDAADLCNWLDEEQRKDDNWFVRSAVDKHGRLQRLFWMNPIQKNLYHRYHDVVLNDSTFSTNRFKMPLNVFVVVDTDGKTRLVGCALVTTETTGDYIWILRQLMEATNEQKPGVVMIDAEAAMEAACRTVLPDTRIVRCIWHLTAQNLPRNLSSRLGKDNFPLFKKAFWIARNTITEREFEIQWDRLVERFGDNPEVTSYLTRLKGSCRQWAWAWVGSRFTAGMQSTQRVERTHAAIKSYLKRGSTVKELFEAIEKRVSSEQWTKSYLEHKMSLPRARELDRRSKSLFPSVHETNKQYLGMFALTRTEKEMAVVLEYMCQVHEKGERPIDDNNDWSQPSDELPVSSKYTFALFMLYAF